MKKQEIKEALNEIINYSEKCRVEKDTDYYQGWRDCLDFVTKELNYLNDKIKTPNYEIAKLEGKE